MNFPVVIGRKEFLERCAYCDGICGTCGTWTFDTAEPMGENYYCNTCENKTVFGMKKAEAAGLLQFIENLEK